LKHPPKIRLDQILVNQGQVRSRQQAKASIMAGIVEVDGIQIDKPGRLIPPAAKITLKKPLHPYVSRGGLKMKAAINAFSPDIKGRNIIDVGASTGGFSDCLLQNGASRIIAVDVGYGQLAWKLRKDPRVEVMERTNARYLEPDQIKGHVHGAVIDASFISLKLLTPAIARLLSKDPFIIALIKPQFEVGKGKLGKGGVVRDPKLHHDVLTDLDAFFMKAGWKIQGQIPSPILGPKGNREFLVYLRRQIA